MVRCWRWTFWWILVAFLLQCASGAGGRPAHRGPGRRHAGPVCAVSGAARRGPVRQGADHDGWFTAVRARGAPTDSAGSSQARTGPAAPDSGRAVKVAVRSGPRSGSGRARTDHRPAGRWSHAPGSLVAADHEADPGGFPDLQVADPGSVGWEPPPRSDDRARRGFQRKRTPRLHGCGSTVRVGTPRGAAMGGDPRRRAIHCLDRGKLTG